MLNIQLDKSRVEKLITKAKPSARIELSVKEEPSAQEESSTQGLQGFKEKKAFNNKQLDKVTQKTGKTKLAEKIEEQKIEKLESGKVLPKLKVIRKSGKIFIISGNN